MLDRMSGDKIKVAMICHFSNEDVRGNLPLEQNRLVFKLIRKLLRMPGKTRGYGDVAPWDTNIINAIKERGDIELTIISAHEGLKKSFVSFEKDGIHYNFLRCEVVNFLKRVIKNDNLWRKINPLTPRVKRIVEQVSPDLILLVGTENAHISSSILKISGYPVFVLCQTVYNNPEYASTGKFDTKIATTEREIMKNVDYVAVYSQKHYELLRGLGYKKYIFSFNWPVTKSKSFQPTPVKEKKYDFINFALRMSYEKGYPDCIQALALVKRKYPNIQLNLVDGGPDEDRAVLKKLIAELGLEKNVTFTPFFEERNDLFQHMQLARFAVLPCKVDHISGTQLQSMQYGLPLVCYETTGTPSLNREKECVLIAEMNDVEDLAKKMMILLDDKEKADLLRLNSLEYMGQRRIRSLENMPHLVENFHAIISNYRTGTPIPREQLFEPSKDKQAYAVS